MIDESNKLLFIKSPNIVIANVTFITRVAIQYNDTPMLELIKEVTTLNTESYTTKIPIYNKDGVQLADAKGSQLYPTEAGKKVGVAMLHFPGLTVCELKGQPIFEIRRKEAAAVSVTAELFTYDGSFMKWSDDSVSGLLFNDPSTPFQAMQAGPGGKGLRIGYPGGGTVIMGSGSGIKADIGILFGTTTKPHGGVGIQLGVPG
ncbi:MAG: hypothetical protein ABSA16_11060 [Thermoguttaceae bacterium]|jgi:hypothetical protein